MPLPASGRWQQLSPYLDQALTLTDAERAEWLEELRQGDPSLAAELQQLLEQHRVVLEERFLEQAAAPPPAQEASAGQSLGAYRLLSPIGEGGMGSVWLAERSDGRFQRRAAVKFIHLSLLGHGGEERFKREGSILARLAHPNIAQLLDAGVTANGQPYLVLEHVEGEHLDRYCDQRRLDLRARIALFQDVLKAVAHAHANLIVHRDLKPSNVLVTNDGQVKLLDFGIAKLLESEADGAAATLLTKEGAGALTPAYAAPEQITADPVTTATDVYALGVLLYGLLTGRHPAGSPGSSTAALVKAIVETEPAHMSDVVVSEHIESQERNANAARRGATPEKLRRALRGDLDTIVAKALKKDPEERYGSVGALAEDLQRYLRNESISARPDTLAYRFSKFVRRNRVAVALATVAVLATIGGISGTLLQARTARRQRDAAYRERDRADRITDYMVGMFNASDPLLTGGASVTARQILDKASSEIEGNLTKDPELQAKLMRVMGAAYGGLGVYDRSEALLRRAIATGEASGGADDPERLMAMNALAYTLVQEGKYTEGERMQREALAIQQRVLGPDHPNTVETMGDLSGTLALQGKLQDAEQLARTVLERDRHIYGREDHHTIATMDNLAAMMGAQGRYKESEALSRETADLEARIYGSDFLGTQMALANLADTLYYMGRYDDTRQLLQQILATETRVVGPHHPETARSLYNLGCLAAREGKRNEAFADFNQAMDDLSPRNVPKLDNDPDLKPIQSDPRFAQLMARARRRPTSEARCPL